MKTVRKVTVCAIAVAVVVTLLGVVPGSAGRVGAAPGRSTMCWSPPVTAPVRDPFRAPPCPYCPGNRGIEYAVAPGTPVRAVATGTVTFAGAVGGTRYVVVELANGWRVTYGGVAATAHRRGDVVVAGAAVGTTTGSSLYFGLRIGDEYVDPAPHLGQLVGRPRLVPLSGPGRRVAPVLRCLAVGASLPRR